MQVQAHVRRCDLNGLEMTQNGPNAERRFDRPSNPGSKGNRKMSNEEALNLQILQRVDPDVDEVGLPLNSRLKDDFD